LLNSCLQQCFTDIFHQIVGFYLVFFKILNKTTCWGFIISLYTIFKTSQFRTISSATSLNLITLAVICCKLQHPYFSTEIFYVYILVHQLEMQTEYSVIIKQSNINMKVKWIILCCHLILQKNISQKLGSIGFNFFSLISLLAFMVATCECLQLLKTFWHQILSELDHHHVYFDAYVAMCLHHLPCLISLYRFWDVIKYVQPCTMSIIRHYCCYLCFLLTLFPFFFLFVFKLFYGLFLRVIFWPSIVLCASDK